MSSKLFAFQMAKPVGTTASEHIIAGYDPQAQTLVWHGGERAQAAYCTGGYADTGDQQCNAYGDYCSTWDYNAYTMYAYTCD